MSAEPLFPGHGHRVEISMVSVTPVMAAEWLSHNDNNRRPKKQNIDKHVRDMRAGRWRMTGEPIKFAWTGQLVDGQNRLLAVVRSNCTIDFMVVTGLELDAQDVMDAGSQRSAADQLQIRGVANSSKVAAIAAMMIPYNRGAFTTTGSRWRVAATRAEILDYVAATPGIFEAVVTARRVSTSSLPMPIGALGATVLILSAVDADAAAQFFDDIASIRATGEGDPIATLIKRVMSDRAVQRRTWPAEYLFMIIRCWNAWRMGERVSHFKLSNQGGYAAIPDPV